MANEQKKELKKDLQKYSALAAFAKSEAGEILLGSLLKDMASGLDSVLSSYQTKPDVELRAGLARVHERLLLYRSLKRANKNKKITKQEIEEIIEDPEEIL